MNQKLQKFTFSILLLFFSQFSHAFQFNLFGDIAYHSSSEEKTFELGAINFNAEENISDTAYVTVEVLYEDVGHGFEIDVERFSLTKNIGDSYIRVGKFVEPLGFWNFNFHHGSLSQDTIHRPFFLELENQHEGVFPAHLVGVMLGGEAGDFVYQLAIANSNGINSENYPTDEHLDLNTIHTSDPSSDKTAVLRASYNFTENFTIGLMALTNDVVETGETSGLGAINRGEILFEQSVTGLEYSYTLDSFYSFGEFYQIDYTDNPGITGALTESYSADAYYLQLGYSITDTIRSAYRYETLDYEHGKDTFFELLGIHAETHHILSLNYRLEASHSLRIEVNREQPEEGDAHTEISLQWFFLLL